LSRVTSRLRLKSLPHKPQKIFRMYQLMTFQFHYGIKHIEHWLHT